MKKVTKLLSVFLIAGVIGTGAAAGVVGCSPKDEHKHTAGTEWVTDETHHWHVCEANDGEKLDKGEHKDDTKDGKCDTCGKAMAAQTYTIPAGTTKLIIKGIEETSVDLSESKKSHTIDKSKIKVAFADEGGTEKGEVPAANLVLELKDPKKATASSWENLKLDGDYKINAKLQNCEVAAGSPLTADEIGATATVTVNNPIKAGSLAAKTSGTFTQVQGADTISSTWTYEVTRANGDKEDVAKEDVSVGIVDTIVAGENKTVPLALKGTDVTGTVTYTITADATKVSKSYVLNFNNWTDEQIAALPKSTVAAPVKISDVFTVVAGGGKIDEQNTVGDNLFYNTRMKLGGKSDEQYEEEKQRFIKVTAEAAGTLTIYAYANTGTAPEDGAAPKVCSARRVGVYKTRTPEVDTGAKDTSVKAAYSDPVGTLQDTYEKYMSTHTFQLPAAGEYYIAAIGGDICFTMVKLDMLVAAGEGVTAVPAPAGEDVVGKLSISTATEEYKQVIKKGAAFTVDSEYTVKALIANNVTGVVKSEGAVTEGLTYWLGDTQLTPGTTVMEKLGENKITVKYGDASEDYNIIVESAVDGIYGVQAALKSGFKTQIAASSADTTITVKKGDIEVKPLGENTNATVTYVVKKGDTVIDENTGLALAKGDHTLTVVITVTDGSKTYEDSAEIKVKITKEGELNNVEHAFTAADVTAVGTDKTAAAVKLNDNITIGTNNKAATESLTVDGVTYEHRVQIGGSFKKANLGDKTFAITVEQACTITVVAKAGDATRKLGLYDAEGNMVGTDYSVDTVNKVTFTVSAAGTYYLGSSNSSINVWYIGINYSPAQA